MSEATATSIAQDAIASKRSNKDLTAEEKEAKRMLKKELKQNRKRARLEARLQHAVSRRDPLIEKQTREKLAAMGISAVLETDEKEDVAREFVLDLYRRLKRSQGDGSASVKQQQTDQAVNLLRHMTKGTQDKSMFDDEGALWGYARQKFQERAILVYTSFAVLRPEKQSSNLGEEERERRKTFWAALTNAKTVCSIACGPGCDAVGVLAFMNQYSSSDAAKLESVVLVDYAMDKWRTIIDALSPLIKPALVEDVCCGACDISESLDSDVNSSLKQRDHTIDIYLFSYILTETRDKWEGFLRGIIDAAKSKSLFYFAEPTPWQLHRLRKLFPNLEYVWVDSSVNQSNIMQAMDGRLGPGVLMARKP